MTLSSRSRFSTRIAPRVLLFMSKKRSTHFSVRYMSPDAVDILALCFKWVVNVICSCFKIGLALPLVVVFPVGPVGARFTRRVVEWTCTQVNPARPPREMGRARPRSREWLSSILCFGVKNVTPNERREGRKNVRRRSWMSEISLFLSLSLLFPVRLSWRK